MNDNAAHAEEITVDVPFKVAEQNNGQQDCTRYFDPEDSRIQVMRCYFTNLVMDETYQPATLIPMAAVQPDLKIYAEGLEFSEETSRCEVIPEPEPEEPNSWKRNEFFILFLVKLFVEF